MCWPQTPTATTAFVQASVPGCTSRSGAILTPVAPPQLQVKPEPALLRGFNTCEHGVLITPTWQWRTQQQEKG